jgi:adenylate cyclase class 2
LDDVEIEIDSWPQIPVYLEIEAKSSNEVKKMVKKLGFDLSETTSINTNKIYQRY